MYYNTTLMRKYSERSPASPSTTSNKNITDNSQVVLPMRKSTRDWSTPPSTNIQNLSLISRSSGSESIPSLKTVELQIELWNDICQKTSQVKNPSDTKQWAPLVDLFRKLREGIWASHWSEGNIRFAVKVYEESIHTSLRAHEFAEFRKAIRGLVDDLYILHENGINGHYLALDVIYRACHLQQPQEAMDTIYKTELSEAPYHHGNEIKYAKQIVHALSTNNWVHFFRLYHNPPHPAFPVLLKSSVDPVRQHALLVMQKAYHMAPLPWLYSSLGFIPSPSSDYHSLVSTIHDLHTPTLIDRIENDTLYFKKKSKQ